MDESNNSFSKISFEQNMLTEKDKQRYAKRNSHTKPQESRKKSGTIISKLNRTVDGVRDVENHLLRLKNQLFSDRKDLDREKIIQLELEILNKISNSYIIFRELCESIDDEIMVENQDCWSDIEQIKFVKGQFFDDMFVLKTPRLLSRNLSAAKLNPNHMYYKRKDIFCQEVKEYLESNKERMPMFKKKNIAILSVYESKSVTIMDNDNLDFKDIVDIIGSYSGGDSGERCSFFLSTICDSTIEEGTYFVVSGNFSQPIHQEDVRKLLQKYFPTKCFMIEFDGKRV